MNDTLSPRAAADQAQAAYRNMTAELGHAIPDAVRAVAEKTVAQTREVYDRSKDALNAAGDTMAKTFDAAGQGAVALNRKIIDIAQRNVSSGFDLAKSLAGAKNLAEMVELQAAAR